MSQCNECHGRHFRMLKLKLLADAACAHSRQANSRVLRVDAETTDQQHMPGMGKRCGKDLLCIFRQNAHCPDLVYHAPVRQSVPTSRPNRAARWSRDQTSARRWFILEVVAQIYDSRVCFELKCAPFSQGLISVLACRNASCFVRHYLISVHTVRTLRFQPWLHLHHLSSQC